MSCRRDHFTKWVKAAAALPKLSQEVPRLLELLSPGALGVSMATSSQLQRVMQPAVTGSECKGPSTPAFDFIAKAGEFYLKKLTMKDCCISCDAMQEISMINANWKLFDQLELLQKPSGFCCYTLHGSVPLATAVTPGRVIHCVGISWPTCPRQGRPAPAQNTAACARV